ncbi:ABC transporter ATP-binding protein/permease [Kiloniella sp. b19]|uniref:ABC transporter ATP-binding protein/permease n=1 Tax=Kiloniella sp. GXU_MW_B19 TaxID=3141326 RepID=UPI0031D4E5A4
MSEREAILPVEAPVKKAQGHLLLFWLVVLLVVAGAVAFLSPGLRTGEWSRVLLKADFLNLSTTPFWYGNSGSDYLLGTDYLGRSFLLLLLNGALLSLSVGILATVFSMVIGAVFAVLAIARGGWFDRFLLAIADIQLTLPLLMVAFLLKGFVSRMVEESWSRHWDPYILVLALALANWPLIARTVRLSLLQELSADYTRTAEIMGRSLAGRLWYHCLPNSRNTLLALASTVMLLSILGEASLSYLGLGLEKMDPSLGGLIQVGQELIFEGRFYAIVLPALALIAIASGSYWLSRFFMAREQGVISARPSCQLRLTDEVFSVHNADVGFASGKKLFRGLSFELGAGECRSLMLPSGAGKSSLAHALLRSAGILGPEARGAGIVNFDPGADTLTERSCLAMMPQDARLALDPVRTIGRLFEDLEKSGNSDAASFRKEAVELLHQLGFEDPDEIFSKRGRALSGGQAQRVVLALVLMTPARFLLLDEPTASLDAHHKSVVLEILKREKERGRGFLLLTHDQEANDALSDQVLDFGQPAESSGIPDRLAVEQPGSSDRSFEIVTLEAVGLGSGANSRLQNVSLKLHAGERLGVWGRSGAGKSSLMDVLCGLEQDFSGGVHWSVPEAGAVPAVAKVFQNPGGSLNPAFTVRRCLEEPLSFYLETESARHQARLRMLELMALVDLGEDILERPVATLSGGQAQRVALIRAIVIPPGLLICDEVTSALDSRNRERVLKLLKTIPETAIVYVSHRKDEIASLCHRVVRMEKGRIVEDAPF